MNRWYALGYAVVVAHVLLAARVAAEDWPGWRGPRGDGTSLEKDVPVRWSATENVAWKTPIPGVGHSSPIVSGDRIFLTSCLTDNQDRVLLCLDRTTGNLMWQRNVVHAPLERKHDLNSFASGTPATDGRLVYVTFLEPDAAGRAEVTPGSIVVAAYDFDGRQAWLVRPGRFASRHGYCTCPVLYKDLVIINADHDGDSYLAALDRASGKTVWKTPRQNKTRSYCTPLIRTIDGRVQMILSGDKCVASYDPADGSRHWIIDGPTEQFVASLVYNGDLLFLTAGFPEHHMMAIRPDGRGNVTNSHIVWRTQRGASYVPSPIASGKFFLITSDDGIASCFDAASGARHWMRRLGQHYSGSPILAGGLVYFTADEGQTRVVRPGTTFDELAANDLGERIYSSPAASAGHLVFRTERHLLSIGK
jgi:hypothetical protein